MGNNLSLGAPTVHLDYYFSDVGLVYESSLGNGRFLKTIKCLHDEGAVVVKVYIKRSPKESLADHIKILAGMPSICVCDLSE